MALRYSLYLLYLYKSTNTDAEGAGAGCGRVVLCLVFALFPEPHTSHHLAPPPQPLSEKAGAYAGGRGGRLRRLLDAAPVFAGTRDACERLQ